MIGVRRHTIGGSVVGSLGTAKSYDREVSTVKQKLTIVRLHDGKDGFYRLVFQDGSYGKESWVTEQGVLFDANRSKKLRPIGIVFVRGSDDTPELPAVLQQRVAQKKAA